MARVIHLSQLAPEDVTIDYGDGRRLTVPGDTDALTMMRLSRLQLDVVENQIAITVMIEEGSQDKEAALELRQRQEEIVRELDAEILTLLRIRQPEIEATGMSTQQLGSFLEAIVNGFRGLAGEEIDDPPPTPNRAKRRAARSAPRKTPSKPSSGSASS